MKLRTSVTLSRDLVNYLETLSKEQGCSRSRVIEQILEDYRLRSSPLLSNEELATELSAVRDRVSALESRLDGLEPADYSEVSEGLPEDVPSEVREWIEFQLENKGYIRWGDDKDSWIALGVGDSGRTFRGYMKDCGLEYDRSDNKWVMEG